MMIGRPKVFEVILCGCIPLLPLSSACTQQMPDTRAADEAALRELDAKWSETAAANDLEGTLSYYSDDAVLLPPNAPIATSKDAIRASWRSLLGPGVSLSWQVAKADVARSSELAYLYGTYQLSMKDPQGNPISDHGKFLEVWKKQADGKWKAVVDTYNSDLPLPAPATPKKKK